jgi:hypothetical protein
MFAKSQQAVSAASIYSKVAHFSNENWVEYREEIKSKNYRK